MRHLHIKLLLTFLVMLPAWAWALPSDRDKPINIEADHAELDDQSGVTQYKGKAILTQGTLKITGDIITFYYDKNKQLQKAVAVGNPATYQQVEKVGETPVRAKSLQMEYYAKKQKVYLLGKGHVWQNGNEFTGNKIEYDITRNVVNANSAPVTIGDKKIKQSGRIHIIIQPPPKSKSDNKKSAPSAQPAQPETKPETKPIDPEAKNNKAYPTGSTTTYLNVRTGPGTQYEKLGTFDPSTHLIILTQEPIWIQVRGVIDGKVVIGWVVRRYVHSNDTASNAQ